MGSPDFCPAHASIPMIHFTAVLVLNCLIILLQFKRDHFSSFPFPDDIIHLEKLESNMQPLPVGSVEQIELSYFL